MHAKNFRFWASAFYFAFFSASGSFSPFLNAHFQQTGIAIQQIGILAAVGQITMLFANPVWAFAADAFHLHRRMLPLAMVLLLPAAWLLAQASAFWPLVILVFIYFACAAPILTLGDSAVMEELGQARYEYGRLRIWGAIGYGLAAWYGGVLVESFSIRYTVILFIVWMASGAYFALHLPRARRLASIPFWSSLRALSTDMRWYSFLASVLLAGLGFAALNNYLILYMGSLGAGESMFGLSVAVAGVSELPVFFFSSWMLKRISPRGMLGISLAALALRLALIAWFKNPWALVAVQLLHGPTFSALWAAGVSYASELTPPGLGASAQSLFNTTLFGLAGSLGALAGGQIYQFYGPAAVFQAGALAVAVGWVVFIAGGLRMRR